MQGRCAGSDSSRFSERREGKAPMSSSFDSLAGDRFRLLVERSSAGMIMVDRSGSIRFTNLAAEATFGYRREELIGKPVEVLVPARLREAHARQRQRYLANPRKLAIRNRRTLVGARRDGSEFPIEVELSPVEGEGGFLVVATAVDVTLRCDAETALSQRAAQLQAANKKLAQFAFVASHDLQEPLREIVDCSRLVDKFIAAPDVKAAAASSAAMRSSAIHARKLVDDLLTYSRTIYGEQQLECLDLRQEIQAALADLAQAIAEGEAEISLAIPETAFMADRLQFSRLMQNIVSNAIKYRKPGRRAKVNIFAVQTEGAVRLAIADEGVGFREEFAHAIFEPFRRPSAPVPYPGTGIELAICKSIADRHGWDIAVKTRPGEGATFSFTIPACHAAAVS